MSSLLIERYDKYLSENYLNNIFDFNLYYKIIYELIVIMFWMLFEPTLVSIRQVISLIYVCQGKGMVDMRDKTFDSQIA